MTAIAQWQQLRREPKRRHVVLTPARPPPSTRQLLEHMDLASGSGSAASARVEGPTPLNTFHFKHKTQRLQASFVVAGDREIEKRVERRGKREEKREKREGERERAPQEIYLVMRRVVHCMGRCVVGCLSSFVLLYSPLYSLNRSEWRDSVHQTVLDRAGHGNSQRLTRYALGMNICKDHTVL